MPKIIENVQEKILIEGRKILIEDGYKGLNIREIAKKCDIGTGTFYNYFSNKQELAIAIFQDDWHKSLELVEDLKTSKEPLKEKIRKIYFSLQGFLDNYISIFYEIVSAEKSEHSTKDKASHIQLVIKTKEILDIEKENGNLATNLETEKLSMFIISNLTYLSKNKYITFDELYDHMKI
jgi:AcrR family transcriptional regulator